MAAYRFADANPVFFDLLGLGKAANGKVYFFERGTTTPKATYSDPTLETPNTNPVLLDSDGRAATEIWLDGEYDARLEDADENVIWTRVILPAVSVGNELPSMDGHDGEFLATDGSMAIWVALQQLPDPTGSAGMIPQVNSDGTAYILTDLPEPPEPPEPEYDIDFTDGYTQIGDRHERWGSGSVAAAPTVQKSSVNIAFAGGFTFDAVPVVVLVTNTTPGGSTPSGRVAALAVSNVSTTGFTVTADVSDDDTQSNYKLANATNFAWYVMGKYVPDA